MNGVLYADVMQWDMDKISAAFSLSQEDVFEYFTNARAVSFIIERRLAKSIRPEGQLVAAHGGGFNFRDISGGLWEIRSLSKNGLYFCPSHMMGSGRSFNEQKFITRLNEIKGFVISDIVRFPTVPFFMIDSATIKDLYWHGQLGNKTKCSRAEVLGIIHRLDPKILPPEKYELFNGSQRIQ